VIGEAQIEVAWLEEVNQGEVVILLDRMFQARLKHLPGKPENKIDVIPDTFRKS
jgi:hypothetical protein